NTWLMSGAKMIMPLELQVPPRPFGASAKVVTEPPLEGIRLSFPSAKKPIWRLSADQNGRYALSVPDNGWGDRELSRRTQSCGLPCPEIATKTIWLASGDMAALNGSTNRFCGITTLTRALWVDCIGFCRRRIDQTRPPIATTAIAQATHSRLL